MFAFLKRFFLIVLGLLLIAVFIWVAGPYFAFAEYRPLATVTARLIATAVVVACWFLLATYRRLKAYRASDKLLAAVVAQPQPESTARPSAEALKLRERFEQAVATLKQQRRGGHSLYDLPWYVIIGAPGSGKTTALLNSGLKFPLEQRVGKGAFSGVGGTRNCDWWFTDEAVFLDTAGRYMTQDSDATSDSAGWAEFLALLRKYRARRPVNGVILTIDAQDLIAKSDAVREVHVEAARRRLSELNRELRIQLPVYVVVTKCDLVAGFTEYFEDLTHEGRAQVWGVTFPYEQTLNSEAAQLLPAEFDDLMARLNARVFARLEEVRDVRRRTKVFAFPQQMAALRDTLAQLVGEVFSSTQFDRQILLRGVYFTSGTQDGTPIDRLLAGIGRRFGVAPEAIAPASGPGKAYFVERLLKDVLIGESGLAGVNRRVEARKAAAELGAYAAVGFIAVAGVVLLTISYGRNRGYLEQTATEIAAVQQLPPVPPAAALERILPRLDAIRSVVDSADRYRDASSWAMRWGLYQGRSIGNAARDAYVRELDGMLLPRVAARIRSRMVEYARDPERLYGYLKAYLMLGEPEHLDRKQLQPLAEREWTAPGSAAQGTGPSLSKHFQSLLDAEPTLRPLAIDRTLVAQARNGIRQVSMPRILYDGIKRAYADDRTRELRLDALIGMRVDQVFRRQSGRSLSEPIPSLYARPVFEELTGARRALLVKQLADDSWVWGDGGILAADPAKTVLAVTNLYEADYIRAWDEILNDLRFVPFATVAQTIEALQILTATTSPLRGLLRVVVDNTALVQPPKPGAAATAPSTRDRITERLESLVSPIKEAIGAAAVPPGAIVTAHFQPLQQLMAGEPGKAPIDEILKLLADIEKELGTLGSDLAGVNSLKILSSPVLRELLQTLKQRGDALPPGLRTLISEIPGGAIGTVIDVASRELEQRYELEVLRPCRELIANRYPFQRETTVDVQLSDFANVFGYGGIFDRFFTANLAEQVDTTAVPWKWRPGSANASGRMLETFVAAAGVREMFFAKGAQTPTMSYGVTLRNLDPSATRVVLQIDGQLRDAAHGPPVRAALEWPGPKAGGEVVTTFEVEHASLANRARPENAPPFYGPWALFRMIDRFGSPPDAQSRVTVDLRSPLHRVQVVVDVSSARSNPVAIREWRQFTCGT